MTKREAAPPAAEPRAETSKPSQEAGGFALSIDWVNDYEFRVRFDKAQYPDLVMDEPSPLGADKAPNPSRVLAAAIGNCLCASLLFCMRKARVELKGLHSDVHVHFARNDKGRLRIGRVNVEISPKFAESEIPKAQRCLGLFEDYCVVTQSVRQGIDIQVTVRPQDL